MSIGILMDDAIVISESIEHEYNKGKSPLDAAINGTRKVFRGVVSSYLTSAFLFGSLLMMKGDMGQILGVLPVVLLSVLTISLLEAMLVLPHHLMHSLAHAHHKKPPVWRQRFEAGFDRFRHVAGKVSDKAIEFRYITVGVALAFAARVAFTSPKNINMAKKAIEKVYAIKGLPKNTPFSFVCPNLSDISRYAHVTDLAYRILKRFLPGPYTFVLKGSREVPKMMLTIVRVLC